MISLGKVSQQQLLEPKKMPDNLIACETLIGCSFDKFYKILQFLTLYQFKKVVKYFVLINSELVVMFELKERIYRQTTGVSFLQELYLFNKYYKFMIIKIDRLYRISVFGRIKILIGKIILQ